MPAKAAPETNPTLRAWTDSLFVIMRTKDGSGTPEDRQGTGRRIVAGTRSLRDDESWNVRNRRSLFFLFLLFFRHGKPIRSTFETGVSEVRCEAFFFFYLCREKQGGADGWRVPQCMDFFYHDFAYCRHDMLLTVMLLVLRDVICLCVPSLVAGVNEGVWGEEVY